MEYICIYFRILKLLKCMFAELVIKALLAIDW